jgi:hypothetical protein
MELHPNAVDLEAFAARLAYDRRDVQEELQLIEISRRHLGRILKSLEPSQFQRTGQHSTEGPLTLKDLLQRIANHIPHHITFIDEKRAPSRRASLLRSQHQLAAALGTEFGVVIVPLSARGATLRQRRSTVVAEVCVGIAKMTALGTANRLVGTGHALR